MSDEGGDPIPPDVKQAFSDAIQRCTNRWREDETQVTVRLHGQDVTVRAVAELVKHFNDPLPDEDLDALLGLMEQERDLLSNPTYEGGGKALIAVIETKNEHYLLRRAAEGS